MAKSFPNTGVTTGLAADRTAMTGMFDGQLFYETDTDTLYLYATSSWRAVSQKQNTPLVAVGTVQGGVIYTATNYSVSFPAGLFTATPRVAFGQNEGQNAYVYAAGVISTTGFTLTVAPIGAATIARVDWIAAQIP